MALSSVPSKLVNVAVTSAVPAFTAVSSARVPAFATVTTSVLDEVHVTSGSSSPDVNSGVKTGVSFCTSPFSMLSSVPSLKLNFVITVCSGVDGVDGTAFSGIAILIVYSIFFPLDIAIVCVMIFICLFKSTGI